MVAHRSSAWPLTWVATALIIYATLHPLTGWHWPDHQIFRWVLPKPPHEIMDDLVGNLAGYLPLGLVMCIAHLRSGRGPFLSAVLTLLFGSGLSYGLELAQFTVPQRVPSITDWVLNTLGTAWGALAAVTIHALGLVDVWHRWREKWFIPQAGHGLALIWLWPLGLLFPPPLPLGEGQLMPHLRIGLIELTRDTPLQKWLLPEDPLMLWAAVYTSVISSDWLVLVESMTVAMGLMAPMCIACAFARPRVTRLLLLSGAVLVGIGATTLSTAMNFGPAHAFTWISVPAVFGLFLGSLGGAALVNRTRTTCAVLGVGVLTALIGLIHLAPPDPYYAQTLQAWSHGRFIRFHGLSRWFGLLWPYVALMWLVARLTGRDHARHPAPSAAPPHA